MAAGKYQESYSSRFSNCEYQVFLSFRGEDTRKNFTDHLYWALVQAGFHTFRDDDEIRRGENIELELQKATQESKISIIVFSKDYARSRWCLDELVKIMEHKRTAGSIVLPVFYHVNPSEVRNQTGSFAAAFVEQEKRFKEEIEREGVEDCFEGSCRFSWNGFKRWLGYWMGSIKHVDDAVRILDGLYKGAISAIDKLIDRCLVEINNDKRLWMHQLVRAMGREIAHQESHKCQRIWRHEDAFTVLKGDVDAEKLRGLTIDMHALMKDNNAADSMVRQKHSKLNFFPQLLSDFSNRGKLQKSLFPADAFRKMTDVKFLQLNYTNFHGSLEHFPKNLIWLCWHGLSSRSIPNHVCLEKLVVLDLSRSCLVDAWKGKLFLPKLKVLDLRHSRDLIRTPDFSGLPDLEKLILEDCIRLVQIHESICDLQRLLILNLRNCTSLMELPEEMSRLNSLQQLVLDGCSNLDIVNMELEHHHLEHRTCSE